MSLPGKPGYVESDPSWTPQEKWVWGKVQNGEFANFNESRPGAKVLDPMIAEGWTSERVLTSEFLRSILLDNSYTRAIPPTGIQINGAWFRDLVHLSLLTIRWPLVFLFCRFDETVSVRRLRTTDSISLRGRSEERRVGKECRL